MAASGFSLLECLVATALLAVLIAVAGPLVARAVSRERLHAASLETALLFRGLRQRAVSEGRSYGVRFLVVAGAWTCQLAVDGNGNGIRTSEILSGRDPRVESPCDPALRHEGIRIGLPAAPVPQVPPAGGTIPVPGDPAKFGGGDLVSFSPSGSVSGGTLYLTDGQRVGAVVVYGPTGRIRLFRYDPEEGWRGGF
jgi:prepilin-type N-terminal cleavage/methylation domain-containing protein